MGDGAEPARSDARQIELSLIHPHVFATLFERHAGSVHRYLVKRVGLQSAEDLVGETFVTAFRSRAHYDLSRSDARPWLFGIATNLVRHFWRSELRRQSRISAVAGDAIVYDHGDEATASAFFASQQEPIAWALSQLDDPHLDVLLLLAGPGFSYEEVSLALGIPIGTVRSRMSRTRHRLRELLGASWQYIEGGPQTAEPSASVEGTNEY